MVKPCLVDVSELDTDIDVHRPDVGPSWIRRHHVLEQRFSTFHRTVTKLQLRKLADHLHFWTQQQWSVPATVRDGTTLA